MLAESVHFLLLPIPRLELRDPVVEQRMERMQNGGASLQLDDLRLLMTNHVVEPGSGGKRGFFVC